MEDFIAKLAGGQLPGQSVHNLHGVVSHNYYGSQPSTAHGYNGPPPGFGAPSMVSNQSIEALITNSASGRYAYSISELLRVRSSLKVLSPPAHLLSNPLFDPEVSSRWDSCLLSDGTLKTVTQASTFPRAGYTSPHVSANSSKANHPKLSSNADELEQSSSSAIPELVPLDQSWLKAHPLLDGGLDSALEPETAQSSSSTVSGYGSGRRERGSEFIRPGFEKKVQALGAPRGSPRNEVLRSNAGTLRKASPPPSDDRDKGEAVRFAKGPSPSSGFAIRIQRRKLLSQQSAGIAMSHNTLEPYQVVVESNPIASTARFLQTESWMQPTPSEESDGASRAFGHWFTQPNENRSFEVVLDDPTSALTSESSDVKEKEDGLAPNVLSFFNAVKAQATSTKPREEKKNKTEARNVHPEKELETDAREDARAVSGEINHGFRLQQNHQGPGPNLFAQVSRPSSAQSFDENSSNPQRFSAEQFFGLFSSNRAMPNQGPTCAPQHLPQNAVPMRQPSSIPFNAAPQFGNEPGVRQHPSFVQAPPPGFLQGGPGAGHLLGAHHMHSAIPNGSPAQPSSSFFIPPGSFHEVQHNPHQGHFVPYQGPPGPQRMVHPSQVQSQAGPYDSMFGAHPPPSSSWQSALPSRTSQSSPLLHPQLFVRAAVPENSQQSAQQFQDSWEAAVRR